jgi:hypothetical protein
MLPCCGIYLLGGVVKILIPKLGCRILHMLGVAYCFCLHISATAGVLMIVLPAVMELRLSKMMGSDFF